MAASAHRLRPSSFQHTALVSAVMACFSLAPVSQAEEAPGAVVTINGRLTPPSSNVSGFAEAPAWRAPVQTSGVDAEQLKAAGARSMANLVQTDASVGDAYNSEGYVTYLKVRGFQLDNRFNFRRDGLPINAETYLPLENKSSLEILKGASGIQAGTSAPGGLVNAVVKRPLANDVNEATLAWRQAGEYSAAVDLNHRFGTDRSVGLRVNLAAVHLDPALRSAKGDSHLAAVALEWQAGPSTLLEAEAEVSHHSQPSQPGFSLLGDRVPDPRTIDPRINLNNQPWSQPVVFDGVTESLRLRQRLASDWLLTVHLGAQRLRTDDRAAFPFGCSADNAWDRYCKDGSFDLYDFRSDNEHRDTDSATAVIDGKFDLGGLSHVLSTGVLVTRFTSHLQGQAYNWAGVGSIDGKTVTPPAPDITDTNTNRTEKSTEFFVRDSIRLGESFTTWLGLRHSRLNRQSVRTDGSRATAYDQSVTTPWAALGLQFAPEAQAYISWGQGIETDVTPNKPSYSHPGAPLPVQKSRQLEVGVKGRVAELQWAIAAFDITRPAKTDTGSEYFVDGQAHHQGLEASAQSRMGAWQWDASALWLKAQREKSATASMNGLRPDNTPEWSVRLGSSYSPVAIQGLTLQAAVAAEGPRTLGLGDQIQTGSWARVDAGLSFAQNTSVGALTWRVGVDNVFDRRAWKDTPYQYGHVYLFPMPARNFRASVEAKF